MKKKVLLVYVHDPESFKVVPFGLLHLASYSKKRGFDVKIVNLVIAVDGTIKDRDWNRLKKDLKGCFCVGLSVMTSQAYRSYLLSKKIKENFKDIAVVWGNVHPTIYPKETCENKYVDFVVRGEGEITFYELLKELQGKKRFSKVKGLVYQSRGKVKFNPERELLNMDDLGIPDWSLLDKFIKANINQFVWGKNLRYLEVHTGRGCPYRCNYCVDHILYKKRRRVRDVNSVLDEFEFLIKKYKCDMIELRDDNFFLDLKYVNAFCDGLIKRKINVLWGGNIRANYFDRIDDSLMLKLKKSGCSQFWLAPESGSDRILKFIKKDIKHKQVIKAVKIAKKYGILPICSYMIGLPTETEEEMKSTIKLIRKINRINNRACVLGPQIFRPYPGCELYDVAVKMGFKSPEKLEDWKFIDENSLYFLGAEKMAWIKNPDFVNFVARYTPKTYNTYLLGQNISFWKVFLKLRMKMFEWGLFAYMNSDSKGIRKCVSSYMGFLENMTSFGKGLMKRFSGIFKYYK
jgi:anaerobic magnesium-protoporphyrin IX monomethyl ester cyclase